VSHERQYIRLGDRPICERRLLKLRDTINEYRHAP
jgi:hypothetical protein